MKKNIFIDQAALDSDMKSVQRSERILTADAKILISANEVRFLISPLYIVRIVQADARNYSKAIQDIAEVVADAYPGYLQSQVQERAQEIERLFSHGQKREQRYPGIPPLTRWNPFTHVEKQPENWLVDEETGEVKASDAILNATRDRHTYQLSKKQVAIVEKGEKLCEALIELGEEVPWPKKLIMDRLISIRTSDGMPYVNAINVAKQLPKLK